MTDQGHYGTYVKRMRTKRLDWSDVCISACACAPRVYIRVEAVTGFCYSCARAGHKVLLHAVALSCVRPSAPSSRRVRALKRPDAAPGQMCMAKGRLRARKREAIKQLQLRRQGLVELKLTNRQWQNDCKRDWQRHTIINHTRVELRQAVDDLARTPLAFDSQS